MRVSASSRQVRLLPLDEVKEGGSRKEISLLLLPLPRAREQESDHLLLHHFSLLSLLSYFNSSSSSSSLMPVCMHFHERQLASVKGKGEAVRRRRRRGKSLSLAKEGHLVVSFFPRAKKVERVGEHFCSLRSMGVSSSALRWEFLYRFCGIVCNVHVSSQVSV